MAQQSLLDANQPTCMHYPFLKRQHVEAVNLTGLRYLIVRIFHFPRQKAKGSLSNKEKMAS